MEDDHHGRTFLCREVQQVCLGAGAEFRGETILAITKALPERGA
jgi:hypothetical protein